MALPKKNRLRSGVREVSRSGRAVVGEGLSIRFILTNGAERSFAVVVPVRVAPKATTRNRLRRQTTEALQSLMKTVAPGCRAVITIQSNTTGRARSRLALLLKKSGILTA